MPIYGVPHSIYRNGGVVGPEPGAFPWQDRGPIENAVVLSGGGNRGAIQVGMMRALLEHGITPDLIVGTSIGAINGVAFAGTPTLEGVYLAADVWRRIATEHVFPRRRFHGWWRFLERRSAVFSNEGLRSIVARSLRFERIEDAAVPLVLIATRIDDGAEEWFTSGPALEAVLASSALPGLYPPVSIGEHRYFDGGVLDNTGIAAALAAGAKRIFVFLCGRVDSDAPTFQRPFEAMFVAFNLALGARLRRDLAAVPPEVDVIVVEQVGAEQFELTDFSRTDDLIEEGYQAARDVLDEYERQVSSGVAVPSEESWVQLRRSTLRRWAQRGSSPNAASLADEVPPGSTR
jgi:NTE family protein